MQNHIVMRIKEAIKANALMRASSFKGDKFEGYIRCSSSPRERIEAIQMLLDEGWEHVRIIERNLNGQAAIRFLGRKRIT